MLNTSLLYNILEIQSHSGECQRMQSFLLDYLSQKDVTLNMDDTGNIYVTKGYADSYPCIVSHMDTVHPITKGGIDISASLHNPHILFGMNPETHRLTGIGGDDKCGIYAGLHCLDILDCVKLVFFVDEEIGCMGSRFADMEFFNDVRFVLQADRRGNSDFVTDICGPLSSSDFIKDVLPIIKKFGFSTCKGMMTDVEQLRDLDVGVSVANMSAGYYSPHSPNEYINTNDLENVCNMMLEICENLEKVYTFHYIKPKFDHRTFYGPRSEKWGDNSDFERYKQWWQKFDHEGNLIDFPEEEDMMEEEDNGYLHQFFDAEECHSDSVDTKSIHDMTDEEFRRYEARDESPRNPLLLTNGSYF